MDDRALVAALRAGDRRAFAMVVELETRSVYRTCLRILGSAADAEDVTQETFVAAFRAMRSFRGDGSVRGWLLRIGTRLAFRRLASRRPSADLDAVPEPMLADRRDGPATLALARERQGDVRRAVAALPEPYRQVVALRFFGELALDEIADATGRPVNTVKTHLRRGLERLRPTLSAEAGR